MHASTSSGMMLLKRMAAKPVYSLLPSCCSCEVGASIAASSSSSSYPSIPSNRRHAASKAKAPPPKKKTSTGGFSKKGKSGDGDEASAGGMEGLKQYLYGMDASARKSQDLERFEALNKAIPDPEVHETIMRAWQLHKRKQREQRESEMQERYKAMINAIEQLKEASPYLYSEAVEKNKFNTVRGTKGDQGRKASVEGRIPGLFPRQMQVLRQ